MKLRRQCRPNVRQARACGPDLLLLGELPGIVAATEIALTCANVELIYAKRREST